MQKVFIPSASNLLEFSAGISQLNEHFIELLRNHILHRGTMTARVSCFESKPMVKILREKNMGSICKSGLDEQID